MRCNYGRSDRTAKLCNRVRLVEVPLANARALGGDRMDRARAGEGGGAAHMAFAAGFLEAQSSFPWRYSRVIAAIQEAAMLRDDGGNGGGRPARLGMSSATVSTSARWSPRRGSFVTVAATPMEKTSGATQSVSLLLPSFSSFHILAAMIFRRPCPNSALPASGPATAGACARPAGAKHWRRVARPT